MTLMTPTSLPYLIIGQGLCGTWLSYYLLKAGKKVIVIDQPQPYSATKVASGIINPVTGRRIVRTWRIEELLSFAIESYNELGNQLDAAVMKQIVVLDFHPTLQMKEAFENRVLEEPEYLHTINDEFYKQFFNYHYGAGSIAPCLLIDLHTMLNGWREKLKEQEALLEDQFDWANCIIHGDQVKYKDVVAEKIICCEGVAGFDNPYFKNLPYSHMKGEAIIAAIDGLPNDRIFKHGLSIVPWRNNLFWIGSSYEWEFDDVKPTAVFRQKVESFLHQFVKLPYTIVDHIASDRPANMERRPFVGLHPNHPQVGILNGMGTKGCSLAPFFAQQLAGYLIDGKSIYPDADVRRFESVLRKNILDML